MDNFQNRELDILRYAINNSEEEIMVCSTDGCIIFANDLSIKNHNLHSSLDNHTIFELNIAEFKGKGWNEVLQSVRDNGNTLKRQFTKELPNHEISYYEVKTNIIKNNNIEVVWFFANDISAKVVQENKIKDLNYVMEAILNNIPVYLFVKDSANDFRYIYWNKAFENHAKIPASQVIGNTDYEVFPNRADAEKFRKDDLTLLHKGSPIEFDEEFIDNLGGTRYVHTLKAIIKSDKELPWIIGVSWDITDLKHTEKELIAARMKAEQSDKLKSAFLANMSHEIRTPLNAIVGFSRLLKESSKEESEQYYDIIDNNANLLLQLINDILDISKIEAGTLEFIESAVCLNDLFADIYQMHRHRVVEGVELIYEECPLSITVKCDLNRLLQVITNLLNNAAKFTYKGEIRFGFTKKGDNIEFYVQDTGMGISQKNIDEIFNRFTKLNNFIQGTGLGLSICRTIIDKMNGRMWVESTENVGSKFYVSIPYCEDYVTVNAQEVNAVETIDRAEREHKKILIAEDTDSNFILINRLLKSEYEVMRAIDGNDVVEKFKEFAPDLVLMDIKMPEKDGLEATRAIRTLSNVPIIAVTSFAYDSDRQAALESGCNDFITKPVSIEILGRIIRKYI